MTIITKNEYDRNDFYKLYDNSWSGAVDTLDDIKKADKEEELMDLLEMYFGDNEEVEDTTINDFLWFDRDTIYEELGLDENGEVINDDEDDEE